MEEHAVVVAGGGPTGLMLAAELALAGVDVVVVEPRASQHVESSRAGGLYPRTLEVLDQRGVVDRFVDAGQPHPVMGYGQAMLDVADLPTRHNYVLGLWQRDFEPILAAWVEELGVPIRRGRAVGGSTQDEDGVTVELADGGSLRAAFLVGCDGGRSQVRSAAGIEFAGAGPSTSWLIAEAEVDGQPPVGVRYDEVGIQAIGPAGDGSSFRIVLTERRARQEDARTVDDLRAGLVDVFGTDFGLRRASWVSRFTDATRQAAAYRDGRVLLAGDAAHIHPPHGGQGLNTGVQDAVNLGWKLARVAAGHAPVALLDTYHAERHPVGARVLRTAMALVALSGGGDAHQALRDTVGELLQLDEPRRRTTAAVAGLDIRYDLGDGHPLLGRRMPDVDLETADGPTRAFSLLHDADAVLLDLVPSPGREPAPDPDRVRCVKATASPRWELPVVGEVDAPEAVLIRPDGHVAWAGERPDPALAGAVSTWTGAATAP